MKLQRKSDGSALGPIIQVGRASATGSNGVEKTIHEYLERLHSSGMSVENWIFDKLVKQPTQSNYLGKIKQWQLPVYSRHFPVLPQATMEWLKLRKKEKLLLHLHSVFTAYNNALAGTGMPFLVTPHGGWQPEVLFGKRMVAKFFWLLFLEQRVWRKAAFVCAVSKPEAKNLQKLPWVSRVIYTPNGVDEVPMQYNQKGFWLFLGRLAVRQKGIDQMILAYRLIKSWGLHPPPFISLAQIFARGAREFKPLWKG